MTETWDKKTSMAFEMTWWGANARDIGLLFPWFIFFREGSYLPLGLGKTFPPRRCNLLEILFISISSLSGSVLVTARGKFADTSSEAA